MNIQVRFAKQIVRKRFSFLKITLNMQLQPIDPKPLRIFSNNRDILRDLFTYLDYVSEHSVKRMARSNVIPRADLNRMAKLFGNLTFEPNAGQIDPVQPAGHMWIDLIDKLALNLKLVYYTLKGEYPGYTSSEESFNENYINANDADIGKFLNLSPEAQEKRIIDALLDIKAASEYDQSSNNEFYKTSVVGELDGFYIRGSGTGVMPTIKFPEIRKFLLAALQNCPAGQWLSTQSLIEHLRDNHRYFLIPEKLPEPKNKWGEIITRYGNFYEGAGHWDNNNKPIPDDIQDGFERVEGRYIERFLENIPLIMGFVDVAYDPAPYTGLLPKLGYLKAFRINERFINLFKGLETTPKVTIQPNFDIIIESDFYPAVVLRQIAMLGEQMSNPQSGQVAYVGIFQLKKALVAAAQVKNPDLDVNSLLRKLSGRDLPPNVQIELDEWSGHADQFTLYEGFSLLEMTDPPIEAEKFIAERISSGLFLVRNPDAVFSMLENLSRVPVRVKHKMDEFTPVAETAQSIFSKETAFDAATQPARQIKIRRVITVSYQFPDNESFDTFKKMLAELRCPFQSDPVTRAVSFQQKEQPKFDQAVAKLASKFIIEIE